MSDGAHYQAVPAENEDQEDITNRWRNRSALGGAAVIAGIAALGFFTDFGLVSALITAGAAAIGLGCLAWAFDKVKTVPMGNGHPRLSYNHHKYPGVRGIGHGLLGAGALALAVGAGLHFAPSL